MTVARAALPSGSHGPSARAQSERLTPDVLLDVVEKAGYGGDSANDLVPAAYIGFLATTAKAAARKERGRVPV